MEKQFTNVKRGLLCFFAVLGAGTSYCQILSYTSATSGALNSVATHASGTALARVNGATAPGSSCGTGFSSNSFTSTTTYSSTLPAIETSVTPASGYALNVTGFSVDLRRSSTGPASVRFAYSTDGGSTWTDQGSNQSPDNASCGTTTSGTWTTTVNVSAPSVLKFRVYGFNASSTAGTFQILNLTVNGTVTSSGSCPTPTGLSSSSVTSSSATLSWSAASGATSYNIQYRPTGTTTWTSAMSTSTSTSVSGLSASTTYEFQVQTVCSGGSSSFSSSSTFTTACPTPSGLSSSSVTSSSATLSWSAASGATSYNIQYRVTGTTTWTSTTSTSTSKPISGLTASTTYEFQVQTVCSGGSSSFSSSSTFTTSSASCPTPTGLSAGSITSSGATLSWSAATGATSYNIQYRVTGTTTWTSTTSTSTSKPISGLTASTTYEFQVQTVCSGGSSSFSSSSNFTTSSGGSSCDATLWDHVYNSYRLIVINSCTTFTGVVAHKINEADGDVHIRVTPDAAYSWMINSYNTSGQYGDMVVEPVCVVTVTQSDAVASCTGFTNTVYIPNVGEHVSVTGSYVTDNVHGWNEIHPVTSITIVSGRSSSTGVDNGIKLSEGQIKVYPNPASTVLNFSLQEKPSSVVYITIVDAIGRAAGQYQMLETRDLKVNTTYLPSGKYFYSVVQDNTLVKGGSVIIGH